MIPALPSNALLDTDVIESRMFHLFLEYDDISCGQVEMAYSLLHL